MKYNPWLVESYELYIQKIVSSYVDAYIRKGVTQRETELCGLSTH